MFKHRLSILELALMLLATFLMCIFNIIMAMRFCGFQYQSPLSPILLSITFFVLNIPPKSFSEHLAKFLYCKNVISHFTATAFFCTLNSMTSFLLLFLLVEFFHDIQAPLYGIFMATFVLSIAKTATNFTKKELEELRQAFQNDDIHHENNP